MRVKTLLPLIVGILFGFLAIKLTFDAIQRARGSTGPTKTISVVVANTDIDATSQLIGEMLIVKQTPLTPLAPDDAFDNLDDLVGRVAAKGIPRGSLILPSMLSAPGTKPGLQVRIKEGYRAVAIKSDEVTGVAYNLRPGDFVDVIAVMTVQRGRSKETVSNVILQRVQIGGVGLMLDASAGGKSPKARSITLLVRDEDVPKLHLAQTKGKVTLAMRGPNDERVSGFASASESDLTGQLNQPLPSASQTTAGMSFLNAQLDPMVPREWTVTVFNGPVRIADGSAVHRLTYEHSKSMVVISADDGRSEGGGSNVTGESIMAAPRDDLADRRYRGTGGTDRAGSSAGRNSDGPSDGARSSE